jgi:cytochrome P450
VVLDTAASEATWYVSYLSKHPDTQHRLRADARATARRFVSDRVIDQLLARVEVVAAPRRGGAYSAAQLE